MIPVRENQWGRYNLHRNIQYFGGMDPIFGCSLPTVFHVKHITVSASDMSVADVSNCIDGGWFNSHSLSNGVREHGCLWDFTPYALRVLTDRVRCVYRLVCICMLQSNRHIRLLFMSKSCAACKGLFLLVLVLFLMQSIHAVGANSWYLKHVSNHIPLETFPVVSVLTSGVLCYRLVAWVRKETGYISHEDRLKKTALVLSPTSNPQFNKNPQISHLQS